MSKPAAMDFEHFAATVGAWEQAVLDQQSVRAERYDDEYFVGGWRPHDNAYDVESRRAIEGRNPALIKEVFAPASVLDMGCGPGALMALLWELGVVADGIDFAASSVRIAPPEVRDRIIVGEVTDRHVEPRSYDLVICREVLEHLTVLQVRDTVRQICAASARFAYVTTRFHPAPESLLSFTTEFDVDPTHITLMSKDLLRCLFVLEGFRSRPDLETQMDWGAKGRVLVLERARE